MTKTQDKPLASHDNFLTFYHLLGNTLIATTINFTVWFALVFFLYLETQSVLVVGVVSGLYTIVTAASGFWLGSLVDHHKKKQVLLMSSIVSLGFYLLSFLFYLLTPVQAFSDQSNPALWLLMALLMIGVLAGNIRMITMPTLVTILIPEDRRDRANGLVGSASGVTFLITSVISGLLVGFGGLFWVFVVALVFTVLTIIHLLPLRVPEHRVVQTGIEQPKKIDIKGTYKVVAATPGLLALIFFNTFNNFLGGVFMALLDPYGLSQVSVQVWGIIWGIVSLGLILGGLVISKKGLGKNPLRALMLTNVALWLICIFLIPSAAMIIVAIGLFLYMGFIPYIEAAEQTILQKVVPPERQGRIFGFAQSIEQAASPLTAFLIGPITQLIFIPFMTTGAGVDMIGNWFGTGPERGMALVFVLTGIIGLVVTIIAMCSVQYRKLSDAYAKS